jgi:hypothetical protein
MPGIRMLTDLNPEAAVKTVSRVARRLSFSVYHTGDWELVAQKGNMLLSVFVGAFVAYCYFRISVYAERGERIEIEIQRNTPWWTGVIGVNRVKNWAKSLADEIEDEIEHQGGRIYGREEF